MFLQRLNAASENQVPGKSIAENQPAKVTASGIQKPRRALLPSSNVVANKPLGTRQALAKKASTTSLAKENVSMVSKNHMDT